MAEAPRKKLDAIELLMQDHRELESLFREFEYLQTQDEDAGRIVELACAELKMHDTLKSELFCPALLEAAGDTDIESLLAGVEETQRAIRDLIVRVEEANAHRATRDAHFSLLSERVERDFEVAEMEVFPRAKSLEGLDLASVADRMRARRNEMALQI